MRLPAFSHGVTSFIWALVFGVFIWIGGVAVGFSGATLVRRRPRRRRGIFLYVRVYGEDDPSRP